MDFGLCEDPRGVLQVLKSPNFNMWVILKSVSLMMASMDPSGTQERCLRFYYKARAQTAPKY